MYSVFLDQSGILNFRPVWDHGFQTNLAPGFQTSLRSWIEILNDIQGGYNDSLMGT